MGGFSCWLQWLLQLQVIHYMITTLRTVKLLPKLRIYRHQADICHAYQIVHAHGVPDENIIVMMYDDIAYNKDNPKKGTWALVLQSAICLHFLKKKSVICSPKMAIFFLHLKNVSCLFTIISWTWATCPKRPDL